MNGDDGVAQIGLFGRVVVDLGWMKLVADGTGCVQISVFWQSREVLREARRFAGHRRCDSEGLVGEEGRRETAEGGIVD